MTTADDKTRLEDVIDWWTRGFNAIPLSVAEKLLDYDGDQFFEITPPQKGSRVYVFSKGVCGEVIDISNKNVYRIKMGGKSKPIKVTDQDMELKHDRALPRWGRMWSFNRDVDNRWLEDKENQKKVAACGFRIYKQEDYGYIFGIDIIGDGFHDAYWLSLYKARGLQWHI